MNTRYILALASLSSLLTAQAPAGPTLKWRGSLWASGVYSDKTLESGGVAFRETLDKGNGSIALDGATLGADISLASGWSARLTLLGGRFAEELNIADNDGTGSLALAEAQLLWTGSSDTFKIGRMWTPIGMEVTDQSANITASRGILFCNVLPISQVGIDWHHAFGSSFSTDLYLINGEDKLKDNNQGKSFGVQFTYNHGGASDKFATLILFRGPEQDGLGEAANTGAEGRQRLRGSLSGQWVWGASTLQWEADYLSDPDPVDEKTRTRGLGFIFKQQITDEWAAFARAEVLKRSYLDTRSRQSSMCVGGERKWNSTFARFELRHDRADADVYTDIDGDPFQSALSATLSLGASF